MDRRIRNLLIKALKGDQRAYRKLGIAFLQGKQCRKDRKLARLCLQKAAELGDETGFLLYHRIFSKNKKVIDDLSYEEMRRDYWNAKDENEKKRIAEYLSFGTKKQKHTDKFTLLI